MKTANLRTKKGLIEIELELDENIISKLKITGDFFIYPEEILEVIEKSIIKSSANKESLEKIISKIYAENNITTPGILIDDWVTVIMKAANL